MGRHRPHAMTCTTCGNATAFLTTSHQDPAIDRYEKALCPRCGSKRHSYYGGSRTDPVEDDVVVYGLSDEDDPRTDPPQPSDTYRNIIDKYPWDYDTDRATDFDGDGFHADERDCDHPRWTERGRQDKSLSDKDRVEVYWQCTSCGTRRKEYGHPDSDLRPHNVRSCDNCGEDVKGRSVSTAMGVTVAVWCQPCADDAPSDEYGEVARDHFGADALSVRDRATDAYYVTDDQIV